MAKKFTILKAEQPTPLKKLISPPIPGLTTKPTVILGKLLLKALKKRYIKTGHEQEDTALVFSKQFNTPVFCDVTFSPGSYIDENGNQINFKGLNIQLALISVMNQKNIIETSLQGRNGTVKEYISDGDYQIKIEGKIYGHGANNYPQDDVQKLIQICKAPQAITITSDFLKLFDVSSIVVKNYTIDQLEGIRNYQEFVLQCLSDKELILLKNA